MQPLSPTIEQELDRMITRWLCDAARLRDLVTAQNITPVKEKLEQTASRLGAAAGLLQYTKNDVR